MRQRNELEFFYAAQNEVILDGDDVVLTEQYYPLLLQVPVVNPATKHTPNDSRSGLLQARDFMLK